jgi:UDP-GlcNAc:undecaprenyl-phosphate GlcNAc-1-phosphate transferase
LSTIIFVFLIALTVTGFSTPVVRRLAIYIGFVDNPQARKLHKNPMPMMGGVAIFLGALLGIMFLFQDVVLVRSAQVRGILLACSLVAAVGLIDDRYPLPSWAKMGGQIIAGIILIYFGVGVKLPLPTWLNFLITLVWLVGISNAINFLDNMDGLSAGISAVSASFILLLAALNGQYLVGALAAAVLGATLGFLRYNFKPAQIFMGDAGALFLGFLLAVLALQLRFPENSNTVTWMVPIFALGMPIFDTTLVVFSRIRRGVSPNTAGKDHSSHRLVRLGFTEKESVLIWYLVAGIFGMIAIFLTHAEPLEGYLIGGLSAILGSYAIWQLDNRVSYK